MSATHFSGPLVIDNVATAVTGTGTLVAGAVVIDLSASLSSITGAVVSRHSTGGGAVLEVQVDTPTAGSVTVDDAGGVSTDVVSVIAFGTPA